MSYTLGTAARATGKSKSTIQRAIQSGRMSATVLDDGSYRIDPAELERVFPILSRDSSTQPDMTQSGTHNETGGLHGQVQVLRELIQQVEGERDDLRRRLDSADEARQRAEQAQGKAFAELSRLTMLLTHQPQLEPEPQRGQAANQNPRRAFKGWALAGLVVILVIIAVLVVELLWRPPG